MFRVEVYVLEVVLGPFSSLEGGLWSGSKKLEKMQLGGGFTDF